MSTPSATAILGVGGRSSHRIGYPGECDHRSGRNKPGDIVNRLKLPPDMSIRVPENMEGDSIWWYFGFSTTDGVEQTIVFLQTAVEIGATGSKRPAVATSMALSVPASANGHLSDMINTSNDVASDAGE